jgi:hypothetical protein
MATGTPTSLDEYLASVYEPDCEYVDGELIDRNTGESEYAGLQMIIAAISTISVANMAFGFFPHCVFR